MFKKAFVSVFFGQRSLQLVRLDNSGKRVKKHLFVSLPPGVLDARSVLDVRALAAILINAWKKGKFEEKSVGLVLPEFSTFTKNITIPKLKEGELNEAVRWQAQEYLPWGIDDMVVDWKLIAQDEKQLITLAVAIKKDVLQSYVDATSLAGLFPLVVETPSLALTRIADGEEVGKLIVYDHFGDGLLIISNGPKILASSMINTSSSKEALDKSTQILAHYSEISIEKVVYGGTKGAKPVAEQIAKQLGKPVIQIPKTVAGVSDEVFQELLVPIALQQKNPAGPANTETVNLLPDEWASRYRKSKLRTQSWGLATTVSLFVLGMLVATVGVYLFLQQQIGVFDAKIVPATRNTAEAEVIKSVADTNTLAKRTVSIFTATTSPFEVINMVNAAKPVGAQVLGYKLNADTSIVQVVGLANSLQDVIDFKSALEANEHVSNVQIPISNFEGETDIDFNLSFIYKNKLNAK